MRTFSGTRRRRGALASTVAVAAAVVSGCSIGPNESEPTGAAPTAATLHSLGELDGLTMFDTSWESFRTAKITAISGRPESRTIDVTYEGSDAASCEQLAGFAAEPAKGELQITVVIGREDGCDPGELVPASTTFALGEPLGELTAVTSAYSVESVDIG